MAELMKIEGNPRQIPKPRNAGGEGNGSEKTAVKPREGGKQASCFQDYFGLTSHLGLW